MATLSVPYSFIDATAIVATEMNSNFAAVKTFAEGISAGTNIDAGAVDTSKLSAATIQLLAPTGSVTQFAGATVPTGWILCDGSAVSQVTYSALFTVIGSSFNTSGGQAAPAAGTFRVPILSGRIPVGRNASDAAFDVLGETGGSSTSVASHTHTDGTLATANSATGVSTQGSGAHGHTAGASENGSHSHTLQTSMNGSSTHAHTITDRVAFGPGNQNYIETTAGIVSTVGNHGHTISVDGVGNHSHGISDPTHGHDVTGVTGGASTETANGNLQPYIVLNYIIKA